MARSNWVVWPTPQAMRVLHTAEGEIQGMTDLLDKLPGSFVVERDLALALLELTGVEGEERSDET